jgi:hypothetical protein
MQQLHKVVLFITNGKFNGISPRRVRQCNECQKTHYARVSIQYFYDCMQLEQQLTTQRKSKI